MRLHSKLRSALILTVALSTTAQIALPVLAQGVIAPAKVDGSSYGPIVTIVSPEYSDVIKGDAQISIAIAPRRYPVRSVELLVDGRSVSGVLPVQNKFAWKTGMFSDGPHTLGVRVTDIQGFIGQAETTIYINNQRKIDDKSPILRWQGVTSSSTLNGITKFRLEAADDFGVKYVFLNLNTAIAPDVKPPVASWMTNRPPYEFSIDTSKFEDGLYVLDAYAWDDSENERNALRLTVKFLNHAAELVPGNSGENTAPVEPPIVTPTVDSRPIMRPFISPATSVSSMKRNGAMTLEPSTPASTQANPLRATSAVSSKISRPTGTARALPQGKLPQVQPAQVQSAKNPVKTVDAEVKSPPSQRIGVLPTWSNSPQSTPRLTPIESALSSRETQIASTPVAVNASERRVATRVVLATAPNSKPRAVVIETSRLGTSLTPTITVTSQQKNPDAVSVVISPEANATRNPYARLATAPTKTNDKVRSAGMTRATAAKPTFVEIAPITSTPSANSAAAEMQSLLSASHPDFYATAPSGKTRVAIRENDAFKNNTSENAVPTLHQPDVFAFENAQPATQPATIQSTPASDRERRFTAPRATQPLFSALPDAPVSTRYNTRYNTRYTGFGQLTRVEKSVQPSTRIAAPSFEQPARVVSFSALPTLPRLAVAPEIKWRDKSNSGAAIVIAPSPDARPYYVATQYEDLTAIAARYKMPVSVLAAANKLPQNARVAKGSRVHLPQALTVSYKGQNVTGDVAPLLIGTTSVAPFRFLFEKQGGQISWDAVGQRVTARNGTYEVTLEVGSDKAIVNKEEVLMDMAAFLLSGRTMVPVRFFEKALHAKVEWEPSTGRIFVAMTPNS